MPSSLKNRNAVYRGGPVVEAFPNALPGRTDTGSRTAVRTEAETRASIRLAVRADGNDGKTAVDLIGKAGYAGRLLALLEYR